MHKYFYNSLLTSFKGQQICALQELSTVFKSVPLSRSCPASCPAQISQFYAVLNRIVPLSRFILSLIHVCAHVRMCACVYLRDSGTAGHARGFYYIIILFQIDRYIDFCPANCPAQRMFCPAVSVIVCFAGIAAFSMIKYGGFIDG